MTSKFYDHKEVEAKWQVAWEEAKVFVANDKSRQDKFYALCMFAYPSSEGLHVGHPESYTAVDIIARYQRMQGMNVLNPIGWDAFGLPAENYAIKIGVPPWQTTADSIVNFTRQLKSFGFSYDWSREINTSSPDYYKWTQWIFLEMYKYRLAYKKKAKVNWCDSCRTVLANEQVIDGKCERCKHEVKQKDLDQWFFKITDYAEELLAGLEKIDWPEPIKKSQRNWIGKSEGAMLRFNIKHLRLKNEEDVSIEVFTTRPDTLYGATYMVLAPEHELVKNLESRISNIEEVNKYIKEAEKKSELQRTDLAKEKTGVELKGVKAINPANQEEIPIFIADYVLTSYGTGAIMAVPAHDERDFEFASKKAIPIRYVIKPKDINSLKRKVFPEYIYKIESGQTYKDAEKKYYEDVFEKLQNGINSGYGYSGDGYLINSDEFDGMDSKDATKKITKKVGGEMKIQYRLRDWLVSRQRYWGAPIPIIYCDKCGELPVPEKDLPVLLPQDVDFKPTGESPLVSSKEFHNVRCPKCSGSARREADTMDTFVCSSWYFLRYCDPHNTKEPFSKKSVKHWMPVDTYIGGSEHANGHLLFSRFFTKALKGFGYLKFDEPFLKLRNQGMILGEDGQKMSKSRGNVINPDEVVKELGADTVRLYEMFMGPLEDAKPWSTKGIIGVRRFLEKLWLVVDEWLANGQPAEGSDELKRLFHKTVKKVTADIQNIKFNTAVSAMMILVNQMAKEKKFSIEAVKNLLIILSPFAPHIAEELWQKVGGAGFVCQQVWPKWDKKLVVDEEITIAIQVNGKLRAQIRIPTDITEAEVIKQALAQANVTKFIKDKQVIKNIYVPGRLVNIVVK